jgi:hypothetical protein
MKKSRNIPLPIQIMIYAVLLYAMYVSLSTLVLAIWGESVMGTVDSYSSRLDDTGAEPNRSRTISKGYWFIANGREYRGYVIYLGDEAWPTLKEGETRSERIRYLPIFPQINKPAALCEFDKMGEGAILYHIFAPIGCVILLLIVIRTNRGGRKPKTKASDSSPYQPSETRRATDMFCHYCGSRLPEGAAFCLSCGVKTQANTPRVCASCGANLPEDAAFCICCGRAADSAAQGPSEPVQAGPSQSAAGLIGFSNRCDSPEILAAAQKNRKFSIVFMWILVLLPLVGFPVAGLLINDFPFGESVIIGVGIAFLMLVFNLLALRRTRQPMWEGVVIHKYSKRKTDHSSDDSYTTYMEYNTVIQTDAGRKKTIVERDSRRQMYDYLSVGDRVRYHPRFGTYEKYDKSKDRIIYCNVCNTMNPIQNDRCKRCNNLLFK